MSRALIFVVVCCLAEGCSNVSTAPDYMASEQYQAREHIQHSLFPSDQAVLSNEAIEAVLAGRLALPADARLAVLHLGKRHARRWWSDELLRLDLDLVESFLSKLRACKRIGDASLLPSMLVPPKQTIPTLREAAARFQADLLLIYRAESHSYAKQRFLSADEIKASSTVEAVLLDTRTGIVPFTSLVSEAYTAKKSPEDISFAETVHEAKMKAEALALEKVAVDLARFLDALP